MPYQTAELPCGLTDTAVEVTYGDLVIWNTTDTGLDVMDAQAESTEFAGVAMGYLSLAAAESDNLIVALEGVMRVKVDAACDPGAICEYQSGDNGTEWVLSPDPTDTVAWAYQRFDAAGYGLVYFNVPLLGNVYAAHFWGLAST